MDFIDLPDELITRIKANEYEAIQTIVNEQAREYSDILDSTEPEEIYPMVHEQLPDLDQEVALNVLRYILPTKE